MEICGRLTAARPYVLRRFSQTVVLCILKIGTAIAVEYVPDMVPDSGDRYYLIAIPIVESTATVQLNRKAERARLLTDAVKCVYNLSRGCGGDSGGIRALVKRTVHPYYVSPKEALFNPGCCLRNSKSATDVAALTFMDW